MTKIGIAAIAACLAPAALVECLMPHCADKAERALAEALLDQRWNGGTGLVEKTERRVSETVVAAGHSLVERLACWSAGGGDPLDVIRGGLDGVIPRWSKSAVAGIVAVSQVRGVEIATQRGVVSAANEAGFRGIEHLSASEVTVYPLTPPRVGLEGWKPQSPRAGGASGGHTDWSRGAHRPRWIAGDPQFELAVPEGWLDTVQTRGLAVVDGLLTLAATPDHEHGGAQVYLATWARQGAGYALLVEHGYIASYGGTAVHGETAAKALATLMRRRQAIAREDAAPAALVADAQRWESAVKALASALGLDASTVRTQASGVSHAVLSSLRTGLSVTVRIGDSESAGNCISGTRDWVAKHLAGRSEATVREVLLAADGDRMRLVAAACLVAIRRERSARRATCAQQVAV